MDTTALIRPPVASGQAGPRSDAGHNASASASECRTLGEMFAELTPLIGAVAGYGPPVIFLAGPWLLLAVMLSGAFAFLLTLVTVMVVVATVLVALPAAILAAPYLLLRRFHRDRARRAYSDDHAARVVPLGSTRVVA
jgi:hypothetical protein